MTLDLAERDRRYALVREKMAAQELDALVVIGNAQINQKGFVKYFTNYRSILYNLVVLFPIRGEPRLLVPSPVQKYWAGLLSWINHIEDEVPGLNESLVSQLKDMGLSKARLGLVNDRIMPADTYLFLKNNFPDALIVDATSIIEELRMIKTRGEQELVRRSAALADLSFKVMAEVLKPGMTERQLVAEIDRELMIGGAEDIFHLFSSKPGNLFPYAPSERPIEKGDVVILNTELSGPGGYWVQMVRTSFVGGKPKDEIGRMLDILIRIGAETPAQLRPGRKVSDVATWVRNEILNAGFDLGVHFGHCLGLDVVERPLVHIAEETSLKPGMVLTVHPQLVAKDKTATVWLADTFLVTEGDAEVLTSVDPLKVQTVG
ncbi:MAG: Xaa-Pro peptidase family protein [Syntrophorhabdales bacterium]|jgi:Xaa-Pro aminopeptidase